MHEPQISARAHAGLRNLSAQGCLRGSAGGALAMTDRETPDSALELDKLSKELELLSRQKATANILFKDAMNENKAASNRRVARSDYYGTFTSQPVQWDIEMIQS